MIRYLLATLLLFIPAIGWAAETNLMQDVIYLDPFEVTDTAEEDNLNKSNLRVEEKSRSNNIADFLYNDTEISFKRKANMGDSGDVISIRGFESKRIMINLDGRSISSTGNVGGNYIDFGTIPLDNIDRIEVIKGGSSLEYGNNALGGVINAYTREPEEEPDLQLYATTGGWSHIHDFHNIRASYAQKFNRVGVSMGASHQMAEPYLRNNDYESTHVYPKLYVDFPWRGKFIFGYNYSYTDRGLIRSNRADGNPTSDDDPNAPGFNTSIDSAYPTASGEYFAGGAPTPSMTVIGDGANWIKQRHLFDFNYRQEVGEDAYVNLMFFKNHETRKERNYADVDARLQLQSISPPVDTFDPSLTHDGDKVMERNVTVDKSYGTKIKGNWDVNESHSLLAGWEYKVLESGGIEIEQVDTNYNKAGPNGWTGAMESSQGSPMAYVTGVFLGDKYSVTEALTVNYGLRFDSFKYTPRDSQDELDDYQISPKVTLSYDLDEKQTVTAAAYRNYRTPTLPELYWATQASSTDPNTNVPYLTGKNLKPESETGFDLAYRYRFDDAGSMQVSGFYYDIEDYILHKAVYVNRAPSYSSWAAYNADAVIYGLTLQTQFPVLETVSMQFSGTWQKTEKSNDPSDPDNVLERLDYIPDVKANVGVTWNILDDLVLDSTLNYIGERDYTVNTSQLEKGTLDEYYLLGASLRYKVDEHMTLELYGDNLTDTDYEEVWGYPAMGTNLGLSFKWEL